LKPTALLFSGHFAGGAPRPPVLARLSPQGALYVLFAGVIFFCAAKKFVGTAHFGLFTPAPRSRSTMQTT